MVLDDVNLMGVVRGIHVFLPHIRAHGEGGHIVQCCFDGRDEQRAWV